MIRRLRPTATAAGATILVVALWLSGCTVVDPSEGSSDEVSEWVDESDSDSESSDAVPTEEDDDFGIVEVYTVDADATLSPAADDAAQSVWDMFVRIVTPEVAGASIGDFRVGESDTSDTLAYVSQSEDPAIWTLAANLAYADDEDLLLSTLVHEYAHILSLSPGQTDPDAWTCETVLLDEGCATADSAIWAFDQEFWAAYGSEAPDPANADADVAWEFYLAHEEDFVSDYAATNVVEDFAESFMTFVLEPEPDGDTMTARKLLFFWDHPDYVAIRDHVRSEFGL